MLNTGNRNAALLAERERHVPRGVFTAHPVVLAHGEGAYVTDVDGRRYLDFVGGIGVLNVGHNHPRVVAAVRDQLDEITHTAFQVAAYEPYITLAARLNGLVGRGQPFKTAFFTTGVEAVENAVKIARAHTNRPGVIAFQGGFHGRTLLGMSLTGMSQPYRQNFGPFAPEIYRTAFPNPYRGVTAEAALAALDALFATDIAPDRVAAIIVEPVQGDGGFLPAGAGFLLALREIATQHGIVLIADEIQTGFGRTDRMFGFEQSGIEPDLVTVAKSLAGGFPLSAVVGKAAIMDAPTPGGLGGTYGGNGVACAAAIAVLEALEKDGLLDRAEALGVQLRAGLDDLATRHAVIGEVRGTGFMLAMEIVTDRDTRAPDPARAQRVIDAAREGGLLIIKCGLHRNVIRCLCPLVASDRDVAAAVRILDQAFERTAA